MWRPLDGIFLTEELRREISLCASGLRKTALPKGSHCYSSLQLQLLKAYFLLTGKTARNPVNTTLILIHSMRFPSNNRNSSKVRNLPQNASQKKVSPKHEGGITWYHLMAQFLQATTETLSVDYKNATLCTAVYFRDFKRLNHILAFIRFEHRGKHAWSVNTSEGLVFYLILFLRHKYV